MSRLEDFKSRMQEIKQYKNDTGKGYWDWKVQSLATGGEVEGNTVKNNISEELYIQEKINLKILNAYNNSITRTEGILPVIGGKPNPQTALQFDAEKQKLLTSIQQLIEELKRLLNYGGPWGITASEKIKLLELLYLNINSTNYQPYVGGALGPGCLYTYTSNYGSLYMRSSNVQFKSLPASVSGFTRIDINDVKPGDLVIRHDDKGGNHAMMYDSTDKNGLFLYNHSNGGSGPENYRVKAKYPSRVDQLTAYRFTGTHNDSILWKKEYSVKGYKNGGEVKEEYDEFGVPVTTVATNAVKYALLNGNIELAKKIMSRPNRVENRYYNYPESGRIDTFLNTYDIPIIGDALSLVDAAKYALRRDWNNASTSFLDAASPLAMFTKSTKLNWKDWGAKSKYIPEYEQIEREARANGTWLKNEDGTDFTGDPREWVVKRSKKFKEVFGDNYLEGYTGMRNSYNPNVTIDTYLGSKDRAYTYTPNKVELNRKNKSGVAKLVVPNSETYTVDAFGNDWLHLTDKNINPYNFTNTNLIVSNILTPVISFKNIRDDGPFGVRNVAEDLFVIKSTTPRKSVMYNNGDFDLSNPNIFRITAPSTGTSPYLFMYGTDRLIKKANKQDSYAEGGVVDDTEPVDDETRRALLERNRRVHPPRYTEEQLLQIRYKDSLRNAEINRQVNLVMDAMNKQLDTKQLGQSILKILLKQELEKLKKVYPYKLMLNSLATLGELGSAAYMLGKGAKALGFINNFGTDTGQIVANTIGTFSDGYLLITADNDKDRLENAIELPADMAGIMGGTNWLRRTKLFGKYGNLIDNILDWAGYTAAGYDGIIKPIQGIFNFFNSKDE